MDHGDGEIRQGADGLIRFGRIEITMSTPVISFVGESPARSEGGRGDRFDGGRGDRPEGGRGDRPYRGPRREGGRERGTRRRSCAFCVDKMTLIDYKDVARLRKYLSERGKI